MIKLKKEIRSALHRGTVIPAHPLVLNAQRKLDEEGQQRLTRYYLSSGAGGLAVGVHTTQFQIRDPQINLFERVLTLAAEEVAAHPTAQAVIKVAGVSGPVAQAVAEARLASDLGYDLALVSNNGLAAWSEEDLLQRTREVAQIMPVFGFYLQPAVGGKVLSYDFWRAFADIENVEAIKMAPFNRYQTLEVVRAVCHSPRCADIALYTGNDDNIVMDLLTTYRVMVDGKEINKDIVGGLLGHWAVWTQKAVELLEKIKAAKQNGAAISADLLSLNIAVTDTNAAFFDSANNFRGCIAGLHEVLRRQGLIEGIWCLDPQESLSPGQLEEIDRVYRDYPQLNDDAFVQRFLTAHLHHQSLSNPHG